MILKTNAESEEQTALLVGSYLSAEAKPLSFEYLKELKELSRTLHINALEIASCFLRKIDSSCYLSRGKLQEMVLLAQKLQVDVVIFDDELTPSQQRNLEKEFQRPVIDRTEVILEVFSQRAQTREARLQIELAQIKYQFPRLKRLWTHLSRQRGGGVNQKGEGETQIEIDRRLLKKRLEKLQNELEKVRKTRRQQRSLRLRKEVPTFAIVGYTNAGKSTLLNVLAKADVLCEDKLFATLDTTTRRLVLPNNQLILLIDTVGFIRKLPHLLIASFRSTLEEALSADFLIHLIDASHPNASAQASATLDVLKQLQASDKPMITVLNKIDAMENRSHIHPLRFKYVQSLEISCTTGEGLDLLLQRMEQVVADRRVQVRLRIPQSEYSICSQALELGQVLTKDYEENDILITVELPLSLAGKLKKYTI